MSAIGFWILGAIVVTKSFNFIASLVLLASFNAHALTLKSGEVLGGDGQVYKGASPEQQKNIVEASKRSGFFGDGKKSGVQGSNLWLVVEDELVFVRLSDLRGKNKERIKEVVKDAIVSHLTNDLKSYYTQDGEFDQEGFNRDMGEFAAAGDEQTQMIAEEAARIAEYDVEAAAAFVEANLDLASATDAASREAAEAALEAAVESVSVQEAVEATMQDLNIAEELAQEIVENNEYFKDDDGNFISRQEAVDRGYISE